MSAAPLSWQFQRSDGLLSILGSTTAPAVSASLSPAGFVQLNVGGQLHSADPASAGYDASLAGATAQTLKVIQLDGNAGADHLVVGNLSLPGAISVQTDGILEVQGQISAGGPVQLSGHAVLLSGQVRADGTSGGGIAVSATNVIQSGLLEANGSMGAGGSVRVDFTGQYLATVSSLTSAASTGSGAGGLVVIDGHSTGTLFSSGQYQASAVHGGQGGEIDLFGQQVQLVGASITASGNTGGGWVRVGGDSPSDIAAHGGVATGVSFADTTTVDATTTLAADALGAGNGGRIVVWSQKTTTFGGTLHAQGAGLTGQGGLLEVSSAGALTYGGHASATAVSGQAGRLLLDPKDLTISNGVGLPSFNLLNPKPDIQDNFGSSSLVLSNGNVVVADYLSGLAALNAGAIFLYNGQTGALLGTLTGSTQNDEVGFGTNGTDGVTALTNGNYVVNSPSWQTGGVAVGAATWVSGSGGPTATVSAANSIVGSNSGDQVGAGGVTALTNGNYVVDSPYWGSAGSQVGAVTWGNGFSGSTGQISANNSLVGSTTFDNVGIDGVTALSNGNYVVSSLQWQNPTGGGGAVTWGNGVGGTVGPVSATNSLVGDATDGEVGPNVTALTNGNYVVGSPFWSTSTTILVGAVTWGNGSTGIHGSVTSGNSLIGSTASDEIGGGGIKALSNGNYVVASPGWHNGTNVVGAVTWGNGSSTTTGTIGTSNSLIGSTKGDNVGSGGVTALSNGNYVVASPNWQNGANVVGAVTWGNGSSTTTGTVGTSNSLVGSSNGDNVGSGGVTALTNGNYVVSSPSWHNGSAVVGAATWSNGTNGKTKNGVFEAVSVSNSLVGTTNNDQVGSGGVTALTNGNYVVASPSWQNGANVVGAATWGKGDGSLVGTVNATNSLVGSTNGDLVGGGGVTALSNGNYVVGSPFWQSGGKKVGAATWSNGTTGQTLDGTHTINVVNSLIGSGNGYVFNQTLALPGGNSYLVSFTGNGGIVTEVQVTASTEPFGTGASQDVSLTPSFITATLNTGTAVVLQASNDITLANNSNIVVSAGGHGGNLTLQAGRQIILNSSITTDNGNLTLIANDTAADGVINSERGSDSQVQAAITMTQGTSINAGTGTVTMVLNNGAGNTFNASDDITLQSITAGNISVTKVAPSPVGVGGVDIEGTITDSGNLTISSAGDITEVGVVNVTGATSLTATVLISLNNNSNTFGSAVTITDPAGIVTLNASGNLTLITGAAPAQLTVTAGGILGQSAPLSVLGAASFTGASINLTTQGNAFQGPVTLSSTGTISLSDSTALSVGNLSLSSGATLSGSSITFNGALSVGSQTLTLNGGNAKFDGSTSLAGGTISDSAGLIVGSGATLSGTGTLQAGSGTSGVTVQVGGTLSPGMSPTGLTVNGDLSLSPASVLNVQLQSATVYSQLNVNGNVSLSNATLQAAFLNSYTPAFADRLEIVNNEQSSATSGQFIQGSGMTVSGTALTINYAGGTGNDVVLELPPPPLPVANTDVATVAENAAATAINVLANDTGVGLHITAITQGANGAVAITGNGSGLTYQPNKLFTGADIFTYTITDVAGNTTTGTVVVIVNGVSIVPDSIVPTKQDLLIQGSSNGDVVTVTTGTLVGTLVVNFNGTPQTVGGITGRILVYENGGNNKITLSSSVRVPALIQVGNGNNTIVGGAGNDTIVAGSGSNSIDGGGGVNTLVESGNVDFKLTGGTTKVSGSLTKGSATDTLVLNHIQAVQLSLTGPDSHTIDGTGFTGLETLMGGTGNDTLLAGSGNDVLVGGSGNDLLVAGNGKDMLIAGSGTASMKAGSGGDLLIGGSTIYDNNMAALNAIMAEWTSTLDSYAVRIKRLMGTMTGGRNGKTLLTAGATGTVTNNQHANTLTGGAGMDWYFASSTDTVNGKASTETQTAIP
jgi:hypothetical protein